MIQMNLQNRKRLTDLRTNSFRRVEGERGRGEEGIVRELGMTCTHGCN